jgi:hypothetical protein
MWTTLKRNPRYAVNETGDVGGRCLREDSQKLRCSELLSKLDD